MKIQHDLAVLLCATVLLTACTKEDKTGESGASCMPTEVYLYGEDNNTPYVDTLEYNFIDDHRKHCVVRVDTIEQEREKFPGVCIAISLLKNTARFEWFLEKTTEIGVREIIPLLCERTEKEAFRHDRMQAILISAMLQSQQCWLPQLHHPTPFNNVLAMAYINKFIAHCLPQQKQSLYAVLKKVSGDRLMLIGPEGDFTESEIEQALKRKFVPVTLGDTRLRAETAGIVSATLLCAPEGET